MIPMTKAPIKPRYGLLNTSNESMSTISNAIG